MCANRPLDKALPDPLHAPPGSLDAAPGGQGVGTPLVPLEGREKTGKLGNKSNVKKVQIKQMIHV